MYFIDKFYLFLKNIHNKKGYGYRYLYKVLKVLINIGFPLLYRYRAPKFGSEIAENVVVSFTSFPARINTAWEAAFTLLSQTVRPKHTILWLAYSQFPSIEQLPDNLKRLMQYGLEIKFCDDLRSHKKYYYTMKNYPDAIVVTADDDIFYPTDWLEKLVNKHKEYPECVICHLGHRIRFKTGKIVPYNEWESLVSDGDQQPSAELSPLGGAGALYPPSLLDSRVLNKQEMFELCFTADDLWLKAMALLNNIKAIQVESNPVNFFALIKAQKEALYQVNCLQNQNDVAIEKICTHYEEFNKYLPIARDKD